MVTVMGSMWNVCHNYPICGCKNTCPLMSGSKPKMECVYNHNGITCACATDGLTTCRYSESTFESDRQVSLLTPDIRRTDLSKPQGYIHATTPPGPRHCIPTVTPIDHPTWSVSQLERDLADRDRYRAESGLPPELNPQLGANPKDRLGAKKIDLGIVPAVGIWHEAAAFFDGGIEYDPFNWRDNKVLARVYIAAMRRHIDEWESGIEETSDTGVHHLGAVRACANILLDAQMTGNLIDDRPKAPAFAAVVEKLNAWAKARVAKGRYRNV